MNRQVDTHVHVVSDDESTYPLRPSDLTGPWYRDAPCSIQQLLALMDEAGVDAAVLVQGVSAYAFDNRYTTESARRFPDRCVSVVCIDLDGPDPGGAVHAEAMRGARGVRWWAVPDRGLVEPRAVWEATASLGLPMVLTMLPTRLDDLAATIPGLPPVRMALDHCGFADFSHGIPDQLIALERFPNVHLKVSTIVLDLMGAHGEVRDAVAELTACFGAARLMWGSDFSQTHDRSYPQLAEYGRAAAAKLGGDDREQFLAGTACSLWPELAR